MLNKIVLMKSLEDDIAQLPRGYMYTVRNLYITLLALLKKCVPPWYE